MSPEQAQGLIRRRVKRAGEVLVTGAAIYEGYQVAPAVASELQQLRDQFPSIVESVASVLVTAGVMGTVIFCVGGLIVVAANHDALPTAKPSRPKGSSSHSANFYAPSDEEPYE
jgi:hypothetical protein